MKRAYYVLRPIGSGAGHGVLTSIVLADDRGAALAQVQGAPYAFDARELARAIEQLQEAETNGVADDPFPTRVEGTWTTSL